MTQQDIFNQVQFIVAAELANEQQKITPEVNLTQDLGADYLDLIAMFQKLEDTFNTRIPYREAKQLVTIEQIVNYIDQKIFI
ncbi:acyl carrier protein [Nostoc sp. FACHB-973]|uniref:Acyl carrier protein n=1 Tax=Desmonostoc muscorum LEGE 12446 TaxID=1828758 RepID=A0A8J7D0M6_DESMC|nr:acyl carrier protein [Desmonostoc muscorum]MBD2518821.1 acyl carrier protein [Nostoc sp. FACHB-973]MBX9258927.1 acyl carrier protein [Desmonostoc muscorum CCALA 125]MCF2148606.1 acyl carrier protein [Desmonostoc muscorum LEGE 12446]